MSDKLFIGILGTSKSGKSRTWTVMFGHEVRTGKNTRRLYFEDKVYVDVFLINQSPLRQHRSIQAILGGQEPEIILCSLQYQHGVERTLQFLKNKGYSLYIQWLNPGYSDKNDTMLFNDPGLLSKFLNEFSVVNVRSGKAKPGPRVGEIREYLYNWAKSKNLLKKRARPFVDGE